MPDAPITSTELCKCCSREMAEGVDRIEDIPGTVHRAHAGCLSQASRRAEPRKGLMRSSAPSTQYLELNEDAPRAATLYGVTVAVISAQLATAAD